MYYTKTNGRNFAYTIIVRNKSVNELNLLFQVNGTIDDQIIIKIKIITNAIECGNI